jgi:hypothetical protein
MSEDSSRTPIDPPADATVDPETIPPADSNEALHTAQGKRDAAHKASGVGPARAKAARERQAARFAKAGSDTPPEGADDDKSDADDTERRARSQPPTGRSTKPTAKS